MAALLDDDDLEDEEAYTPLVETEEAVEEDDINSLEGEEGEESEEFDEGGGDSFGSEQEDDH
jgi:hypothetical protein